MNILIALPQRILAFTSHREFNLLLIFDESIPLNYITRALDAIPESIKEYVKGKKFFAKEPAV